jgi:hypothetical protein
MCRQGVASFESCLRRQVRGQHARQRHRRVPLAQLTRDGRVVIRDMQSQIRGGSSDARPVRSSVEQSAAPPRRAECRPLALAQTLPLSRRAHARLPCRRSQNKPAQRSMTCVSAAAAIARSAYTRRERAPRNANACADMHTATRTWPHATVLPTTRRAGSWPPPCAGCMTRGGRSGTLAASRLASSAVASPPWPRSLCHGRNCPLERALTHRPSLTA